ncbi:MAG: BMP family ABC transporter substrate-binding protein [Candidatus Bathyarchaeia archaeon]
MSRRRFLKTTASAAVAAVAAGIGGFFTLQGPPPPPLGAPQAAPLREPIRVHMVLYGHHDEGAWDPQLYGTLTQAAMESRHDFRVTISEDVKSEAAETMLELAARANDVVVASTIVYDEALRNVAPRFPNVYFILEQDPIGENPKTIINPTEYPSNVIVLGPGKMTNNYVIGALTAKLAGPDAKLGFIQSLDIPVTVHTGATFRLGARSVYPEIEVLRDIMGGFVNPVKNRDSIAFMAANGVKAVLIEQDDTSGILEAIEQGIYAIPAFRDLTHFAPDTVICSSVWNWKPGFSAILDAIAEGRWGQLRAENWYWEMTLANGGIGLGTFGNMVNEELRAHARRLIEDINAGAVEVPYVDVW